MKKLLFLSLIFGFLFLGTQSIHAQCTIPNAGFQNWEMEESPDNWYGTFLLKIPGRTGGFAVQIDTFTMVTVPGVLGSIFPCTTRSNYLNGYLKADFSQAPNDSIRFMVYQILTNQGIGALGSCVISTTQANWTPFNIPLQTISQGPVDTVLINIVRFGSGKSTISFDDFSLSNTPLGQPFGNCQTITSNLPDLNRPDFVKIYPNPVQTEVFIQSNDTVEEVLIFDRLGKLVLKSQNPQTAIPVANLPKGVYFSQIKTARKTVFKRFLKF